jgi:hypothetical protein
MSVKTSSAELFHTIVTMPRRPELDALRGLFLIWMTLTHLPTPMSDIVNTPFGFVDSADGFVFLSAMLLSQIYLRRSAGDPGRLRSGLWRRAARLYVYHVFMLTVAFTVIAAIAVRHHRLALTNLLDFYLAHPAVAVIGSLLLIYCPPLLDILPMYVIFLLATPFILYLALRRGWTRILLASFAIWLLSQFGLRALLHGLVVRITHLPIPLQQTGAFDLFAWQWIWIVGLWIGARSGAGENPLRRRWVPLCGALCAFFIAVRHQWLGSHLTPQFFGAALDKWQLGPLRLLNLTACIGVLYWLRSPIKGLISREPFLTLGRASIEVFCAHLLFVFAGLAMLYNEISELHGIYAILLLAATFAGLLIVASRQVRVKKKQRSVRAAKTAV